VFGITNLIRHLYFQFGETESLLQIATTHT